MNGWNRVPGCRSRQNQTLARESQMDKTKNIFCLRSVVQADKQERHASEAADGRFLCVFVFFFFVLFFPLSLLPRRCVLKNMFCVSFCSSSVVFWVTHLWSFWRAVGTTARLSTLPMQTSERQSSSPSTRHTWATGGTRSVGRTWTPPRTSSEWSAWMG